MTTGEYNRTSSTGLPGLDDHLHARTRCHMIVDALGAGRRPEIWGAVTGAGDAEAPQN